VTRSPSLRRLAGLTALIGGIVWFAHTVLLATRPVGCVGAACFEGGRTHRDTEDIAWVLLIAVLLLAVSIGSGLSRGLKPGRRLRFAALVLWGSGAALLVLGLVLNGGRSTGASLWWLHDSDTLGRLLPVLGTLAFGFGMLSAGSHRWLAVLLIVAAILGFGFNAQDERTLLSLPIGMAWGAFGLVVLFSSWRREPMLRQSILD
jgi:hypothetical protein